jgi:hypothetical protein
MCDFGAFVVNMIVTQTDETSPTNTNIGDSCTDMMLASDYASLFP